MDSGVETAQAAGLESRAETASPATQANRHWLRSPEFWLVATALAVRIGFMLVERTYLFQQYRVDDYSYYNETTYIARSIVAGHGFSSPFGPFSPGPTSWVGPVYPYLTAFFFAAFGVFSAKAAAALLTLQSVFSALTCLPILGIASRTAGRRAGLMAAFLWAVFPWFSKWAMSWIWEISLSTLLFACLFWYALRLGEPASRKLWIGFGALWGFALLVNPALLTLLPASLLWCAVQLRRQGREWVKPAALALVTCVLVISPWLVRNRVAFGKWVFLRSNFGLEFWLGNSALSTGRGWVGQHPTGNSAELARYDAMGEVAYAHSKMQLALDWVRNDKWDFIELTARRVVYFWDGSAIGYRPEVAWYWIPGSFAAFSFLLLPAILVARRRQLPGSSLFLAALLLYPLPYYVTFSQLRYRHVLEPLMLLLVCFAATELLTWRRSAAR